MNNEIMSESDVAQMLGVGLRTLQKQRAENGLPFPHVRVGDRVLYARSAVMAAFFGPSAAPKTQTPAAVAAPVKRGRGRPRAIQF